MELIERKSDLRKKLTENSLPSPIGLVPTMGNLHAGHLRLVDVARETCATVIATIFVNPLQFGPAEDFDSYPRMLEKDAKLLNQHEVHLLFAPAMAEMYPDGSDNHTSVSVPSLTAVLCGTNRPGHFDGVTTVVSKLFHLIQPDIAYFGEKDWQQLTVIRQMVRELDFPIQIEGVPTVRAEDGLALSSRNGYLNDHERKIAQMLYESLVQIRTAVLAGIHDFRLLEAQAKKRLGEAGFKIDYVSLRDGNTLQEITTANPNGRVFAAARLGRTRLIDNLAIGV